MGKLTSKTMTIQEQWDMFQKIVMHKDAPQDQRREMKLAFYAGCEAMLRLQFEIGDRNLSDEAGVAVMAGWHDEVERYSEEFAKEAACRTPT
jgi:hypothetical protein